MEDLVDRLHLNNFKKHKYLICFRYKIMSYKNYILKILFKHYITNKKINSGNNLLNSVKNKHFYMKNR